MHQGRVVQLAAHAAEEYPVRSAWRRSGRCYVLVVGGAAFPGTADGRGAIQEGCVGYFSINKCEIVRHYGDDRHVLARVYCEELQKWFEQRFEFSQVELAAQWCVRNMMSLSM